MNAEQFKAAVAAVDLTAEDAREQILSLNEGLMNSNTTLLSEYKTKISASNEQLELARAQAVKAEEDRLKIAGDVEGLKSHYEEQLNAKVAEANQSAEKARGALTERDKGSLINEMLSKIDKRFKPLVKTQLGLDVNVSYGEDGKQVTSIKHGDNNYDSVAAFFDGVKGTEWDGYIEATSLSGAGTKQTNGTGSQSKKYSEMSFEERATFNSQ